MQEYHKLTLEQLPDAFLQLMKEVTIIKDHILNNSAQNKTKAEPPEKKILTVDDVCLRLNLKKGSVYNLTYARQIPFIKIGGRIYFDSNEFDEWFHSGRRKTVKQLQEEANRSSQKQ
jgi:excisionase family DNA binding protein